MSSNVWIGMAHVEGPEISVRGAAGAYVQVLATARSSRDFLARVISALRDEGYRVLEIEDVDVLERRAGEVLGRRLAILRRTALHGSVAIGTLHTYPPDE